MHARFKGQELQGCGVANRRQGRDVKGSLCGALEALAGGLNGNLSLENNNTSWGSSSVDRVLF